MTISTYAYLFFFLLAALVFLLGKDAPAFLQMLMSRGSIRFRAFALSVVVVLFASVALATTIGGFLRPAPYNIISTASECDGVKGRGDIYVALRSTGGSAVDQLALCGAGASGATPAWRVATVSTAATVLP